MILRQVLIAGVFLASAGAVSAAEKPNEEGGLKGQLMQMELRVRRLERLLESRQLVDMLTRLDRLQSDVQEQRGTDEELIHALEMQKKRLHELYLDIDRRISELERGRAAAVPTPSQEGDSAQVEGAGNEQAAYQQAFDLLRELRYERAIGSFEAFLKQYPQADYAPLAQYWIGEAYYAGQQYEQAITAYNRLIANYPDSAKRAEGLLKIGYSQHELGQSDKAVTIFEQIIADYPESTEADQAKAALKSLQKGATP